MFTMNKEMTDIEIKAILNENAMLKEENQRLHSLVAGMMKQILDFESSLADYKKNFKKQLQTEARQAYLSADKGIVGKFMLKIADQPISNRAKNVLRANNCETLGDLAALQKTDILRFRHFGGNGLSELSNLLESKGLDFGMDVKGIIEESLKGFENGENSKM